MRKIMSLVVVAAAVLAIIFAGVEILTAVKWFFNCFWTQNFETRPPLAYLAYSWICVGVAFLAAWYKEKVN